MTPINGTMELPTDPDSRIILAGEYVLGTLDARTAKAVEKALASDAGLAALVSEFEIRLTPLVALAVPEAPPVELWSKIEAAISPKTALRAPPSKWLRLWQGWAIGATLVAAGLAAITLLPQKPEAVMTTVLLADANQQAWQGAVDSKGDLQLAAVSSSASGPAASAPSGHDYQLWALPPGEKTPVSLGVMPHGQGHVRMANLPVQPQPGMLIMISLEPPGGTSGKVPTGPVVFVGRLSQAGPPT